MIHPVFIFGRISAKIEATAAAGMPAARNNFHLNSVKNCNLQLNIIIIIEGKQRCNQRAGRY